MRDYTLYLKDILAAIDSIEGFDSENFTRGGLTNASSRWRAIYCGLFIQIGRV